MEPFRKLESIAVPIAQANVDTDQLLPARYIQKPRANDFGEYLFRDLRDRPDGSPNPDFVLNKPGYKGGRIAVAARNFGCGSSREHAVWAMFDYGFRAVIAPSFGDIFYSNSFKNGFLPVVLPESVVTRMIAALQEHAGATMSVDLESQTVSGPEGEVHHFEIDPFPRHCLLEGLDELGYTLSQMDRVRAFEERYERQA
jgi:3-isopropylmalate/(R)-2-methylmalate dehydratase small subunit